jgi:hypothetical protein
MGKASTNENYRFLVTLVILLAHFWIQQEKIE